ncbi:interferon epsilon [Pseudophryne corroboree]|uniref:interferon epsilon n=1 Tax=Pseudophryne corroboree TaxID=495146 RepID=UPI003081DB7C
MAGVSAIRVLGTFLGGVLFLILCNSGETSHECYRDLPLQRQIIKEALKLLEKMNEIPYLECLKENATFNLAESMNKTIKLSPESLYIILGYTGKLFAANKMPTTDHSSKGNVTDRLRSLLSAMSQAWTECVYRQIIQSKTKLAKMTNSVKKITYYFHRMDKYLKTENYSLCAWASVSIEVEKVMKYVARQTDRLIRDMKNETQRFQR